jgi:hypothetical protein
MSIADDLAGVSAVLNELVPKEDGNLVRSDDWNDLVGQVQALGTIVGTQQTNYEDNLIRIAAAEGQLLGLDARVGEIEELLGTVDGDDGTIISRIGDLEENKLDTETFDQYRATLDPLLLQYTITIETEDSSYALGEVATLTATVQRLDGAAVSSRPWLDFLVSWGDVQAVNGFDTRPGAGGRSVSVRTNTQGIARVRVKAENLANTTDTQDREMAAFLATEITAPGQQSRGARQAILEATGPQDLVMRTLYSETTQRYNSGTSGIQASIDQFYVEQYRGPTEWFIPTGQWRDYRSTIAVFAKDDSNPETPDFGKGVSSIQINFRDWIGPWITHYKPDVPHEVGPWVVDIPSILREPQFRPDILIDYFDERVAGLGLLGKHKAMESMGAAITQLGESQVSPAAGPLILLMQDAVISQKSMDFMAPIQGSGGQRAGLAAVAQAVNQAAGTGAVKGQVASVETQVASVSEEASSLQTNYIALNSRVNETTSQGENLMLALGSIDNKVGGINLVDADSVRGSVTAIKADIAALRFNLEG